MPVRLPFPFSRCRSSAPAVRDVPIVVHDGYHPDTVDLPAGTPVRLRFRREEGDRCSDTVLLPELGRYAELPEHQTVTLDCGPLEAGEYAFSCPHGRIRGKLVVRQAP